MTARPLVAGLVLALLVLASLGLGAARIGPDAAASEGWTALVLMESRLPRTLVEVVACLMFLLGGILLLRGAGQADEEEADTEAEFGAKAAGQVVGWRVVTLSFTVLFLAEWGDLSQILTASLVLKYHDAVSVFVGAFLALAAVSGLAAVLGRALLTRIPLALIRRIGGIVCLVLAALTGAQLAGLF